MKIFSLANHLSKKTYCQINMAGKKSWIRKNMSDNQFRPEQYYCYQLLREIIPPEAKIEMEYLVNLESVDGVNVKRALLDIAILFPEEKCWGHENAVRIAIRINGEVHEKPRQRLKDEDQKYVLEGNGWKVYDFWFNKIPEIWNKKKYTNKEAKKAILREMQNG